MKRYSAMQVAASALIGTPLAAAFLLGENFIDKQRPRNIIRPAVAFIAIGGGYFLVTLLNPAQSRLLDTFIFLLFTGAALLANYLFVNSKDDESSSGVDCYSWWRVLAISLVFLAVWLLVVIFIFNPGL
jgi:hypothetical protein